MGEFNDNTPAQDLPLDALDLYENKFHKFMIVMAAVSGARIL